MKKYRNPGVVGITSLLVVLFLSSCSAGQANVHNLQQPMFASAPGSPIPVSCGPGNVVVGDLNNDGKPDLVVAVDDARTLTVLLASGRR